VDRELLLGLLVLVVAGPLFWICGTLPLRSPLRPSGIASEATRWRALWLPAVLPLLAVAGLLSWAFHEPEDAEAVAPLRILIAGPAALVWMRALVRASRSLLRARHPGPAATVGLVRPRVLLDPNFALKLDAEAQKAAVEHELAHARHHDPLRLFLARLVTDLQWPIPAASRRFKDWCQALELARDEEARLNGADAAALAEAIVTCAKLARNETAAFATLGGDGEALAVRIGRLLDDDVAAHDASSERRGLVGALLSIALLLSVAAGALAGEEVVRLLLRVLA
jgi:hypothetical protein